MASASNLYIYIYSGSVVSRRLLVSNVARKKWEDLGSDITCNILKLEGQVWSHKQVIVLLLSQNLSDRLFFSRFTAMKDCQTRIMSLLTFVRYYWSEPE